MTVLVRIYIRMYLLFVILSGVNSVYVVFFLPSRSGVNYQHSVRIRIVCSCFSVLIISLVQVESFFLSFYSWFYAVLFLSFLNKTCATKKAAEE